MIVTLHPFSSPLSLTLHPFSFPLLLPFQSVLDLLKRDPAVSYVVETKTEEIGPRVYRFKADVAWDGESLVAR